MEWLLLPLTLLLVDALLPRVIDGSEGFAPVGVARSLLLCEKPSCSPFEQCPYSVDWSQEPFHPSTLLNDFRLHVKF